MPADPRLISKAPPCKRPPKRPAISSARTKAGACSCNRPPDAPPGPGSTPSRPRPTPAPERIVGKDLTRMLLQVIRYRFQEGGGEFASLLFAHPADAHELVLGERIEPGHLPQGDIRED